MFTAVVCLHFGLFTCGSS